MAASRTIGSSARGRGGRIRMVGALTDMTATTWPEASRTGAAHAGGAGDHLVRGHQIAAGADPLEVGGDPRGVGPGGRGEAGQALGEHLGLHRLGRVRQQQAAGSGVDRLALAYLAVQTQARDLPDRSR